MKSAVEGGRSGLGWRRWRAGGGQSYSRGWLHSLYLQCYLGSTTYLSSSYLWFLLPLFLLQVIFKAFFVCVWVSVLLSAKSLLCEYWHFQITQIEHFSRPRHAICTAKSSRSKSSCLIDLIPCVFAWIGSVTQSEAFLKTNIVWFATIMQPQIHVMNPAVSKITLTTNSITKYQISLKNERGLSAI